MDPAALDHLRRHSGLRIDGSGGWWFRGRRVENPRVEALFHRNLEATPEGLVLRVGEQWAYVEQVDDTAYFVERLDAAGLRLLSGERVAWEGAALSSDGEDGVRVTLADGRRARLQRLAVLDLAPLLEAQGVRTEAGLIPLDA